MVFVRLSKLSKANSSKQFCAETNWAVFTGAPSSGKSTTLRCIAESGYEVTDEVARKYYEDCRSKGMSSEIIRRNEADFQKEILRRKLDLEMSFLPSTYRVLDRGIPDSITYYRLSGLDSTQIVNNCYRYKYRFVFLFQRLPIVDDGVRTESNEEAATIEANLAADYKSLGYPVIRVPIMSIAERTRFILRILRQ